MSTKPPRSRLGSPVLRRCAVPVRAALPLLLAAVSQSGCGPDPVPGGYEPDDSVEVIVDKRGVPHLYAGSEADAYFASGYAVAERRLFELDLIRRRALGRGAELLGESALRDDLVARTFNMKRLGQLDRERLQREYPLVARNVDAFATGLNRYTQRVLSGDAPLPVFYGTEGVNAKPEYWTPEDVLSVGKLLSLGMSNTLDFDLLTTVLQRLAPKVAAGFPLAMPTRPAFTMVGLDRPAGALAAPPAVAAAAATPLISAAERAALDAVARAYRGRALGEPETGSNNWAVAGTHTADGRPLLAGDPHQPLSNPSRFFAQHLSTAEHGGALDVIGFGFVGAPGVQLGHNRALGWTATTNFADVLDLWEVALDANANQISLGGKSVPVSPRTESILVRGAGMPAGQGERRDFTIYDVPGAGVLLPDEMLPVPKALLVKGEILMNWTGLQATTEAAAYQGLSAAQTLEQWDAAVDKLEVGAVNLIAADKSSIRYKVNSLIPDRGDPSARPLPYRILDGSDPRTLWTGAYLSKDKLPAARDPVRGFLATANNDPWGFNAMGKAEAAPFYYGYYFDAGDRAARIQSELARLVTRGQVTAEDMTTLQADAYSQIAEDLLPALAQAMGTLNSDPKLMPYRGRTELFTLLGRLSAWDRQMRRDASEPVLFFALAHFAARRAFGDDLGTMFNTVLQAEPAYIFKILRLSLLGRFPQANSFLKDGAGPVMVGALAEAADWLTQRFGGLEPERYHWRDVNSAGFAHVLGGRYNPAPTPVDGSVGTVNVSSSTMFDGSGKIKERFNVGSGSLYRMVIGFQPGGQPRARVCFPRGNDEDPQSKHYDDQQAEWVEVKPAPLAFSRDEVERDAERRYKITPSGDVR